MGRVVDVGERTRDERVGRILARQAVRATESAGSTKPAEEMRTGGRDSLLVAEVLQLDAGLDAPGRRLCRRLGERGGHLER